MARTMIEIDVFNGMAPNGIYSSIYIGENAGDPIEVTTEWDEIIETEIEMHCIPNGGPFVVDTHTNSVRDLMDMAAKYRWVADQLEASLVERKILLRDKWMESNNGEIDISNAKDFEVDYAGYLEYLNEKGEL